MWQDYIGIVPGIAAAIMGVVTLMAAVMPLWQKFLIVGLTIIAVGATGASQWWTLHQKSIREVRRTEILEQLGSFIAEGQSLMLAISNNADGPIPKDQTTAWLKRTESFLQTLGNSYIARFRSDAGLTSVLLGRGDVEHNNWWLGIRARVIRLNPHPPGDALSFGAACTIQT